jgi:hypothetical protein
MLPVENEASQEKVSLECKAIKKLHLLIEVKRGEKPLQSHATFSICEGRILASDTKNGVMKSSARGKRLFTLSPSAVLLTFSSSALARLIFRSTLPPPLGPISLGAAPKLSPQRRPCRCEKMGNEMRGIALGSSRILRRAGLFIFPSGIELLSVRCRCPGVNYLQRVGYFKTALMGARELIPQLITNKGEPL